VPCYTTSPQRMIPSPIKRSRILVSGGVVIVISVKFYEVKFMAATLVAARTLRENSRVPTSSDESKKLPCAQPTKSAIFHFRLLTNSRMTLLMTE